MNILKEKTFLFSIQIVTVYQKLCKEKHEFVMSKQLLRSGTAIGALVRESHNAESDNDFIHKLSVAQKECDETLYWLELLERTGFLDKYEFERLHGYATELLRILKSSILTKKSKR